MSPQAKAFAEGCLGAILGLIIPILVFQCSPSAWRAFWGLFQ